ncbi:hypothetical protein DRH29_04495 [candidate division Kazan bacterium]|uniref:Tyr recombinase domain-containing protein n=1 Tax=candidate division Kazan bacterium TaxID=2202143 RepID=A0A420ZBR0_UNCK3|nr:MAG: hypothetical protein DRH29_04495 [candidate division Kazan bacterium]
MVISKMETQIKKVELPQEFLNYVNKKLKEKSKRGRPHIIAKLGSLERVLEVLKDAWINNYGLNKLSKKYQVSKPTLWRFINECKIYQNQIIEYINYIEEIKPRDFKSFEIVKEWERKIRRSGHLSMLRLIPIMANVCGYRKKGQKPYVKGFKCPPQKFNLEKAQQFIDLYLKQHPNKTQLPRHIRQAIRHFLMVAQNINIPRGFGGQYGLSGEKESYGKYAHIRLSEQQIRQIREIMANDKEALEKGFDIGFEIGIQTCSRAFAIASIEVNKIQQIENLYIIRVFEPKVKEGETHLGKVGKYWTKYISKSLYQRIQEFIKQHPKRTLLFVDDAKIGLVDDWLNEFRAYMKKVYEQIGITEPYFYSHPIHSLRHAGAIRLLELTDWNYELVAKLGGWTTPQTLRDCYGAMPQDVLMRVVSKLEHQLDGLVN